MDWPKHVVTGKPLSKDSQNGKVFRALREHACITRNDLIGGTFILESYSVVKRTSIKFKCYRLSARIYDLTHQYGVNIDSEPVYKNGKVADYIYRLVEE